MIALAGVEEPIGPQSLLRLDGRKRVLLDALIKRAGDICSLGFLAEAIGVRAHSNKVVKVYVCQVRAELARHGLPDAIQNVWGMGYLIAASDARRVRRLMRAKASDIGTDFNRESGNE
jgi:DNA-binding response OmpR family regulator